MALSTLTQSNMDINKVLGLRNIFSHVLISYDWFCRGATINLTVTCGCFVFQCAKHGTIRARRDRLDFMEDYRHCERRTECDMSQVTGSSAYIYYYTLTQTELSVGTGYGRIHKKRLASNQIESFTIAFQPLASSVLIPFAITQRNKDTFCFWKVLPLLSTPRRTVNQK